MENYFRDALHNFIFEEAGGGGIRHLANRGYTAKQITDALSFPLPYEKVREAFTKYLLDCGILLREKPAGNMQKEKTEYVREYDRYGKPSFRKVTVSEQGGLADRPHEPERWEEMDFSEFLLLYKKGAEDIKPAGDRKLVVDKESAVETGLTGVEKNIYISCDFGADKTGDMVNALDKGQREYIQGICWTKRRMYHLLDKRMLGIMEKLAEQEMYAGKVYVRR